MFPYLMASPAADKDVQSPLFLLVSELLIKETGTKIVSINPLSYNWQEEMINIAKALSNRLDINE